MLVKVFGAALQGIDAILVTIEVSVVRGASFNMVGLPDAAVKESYQRVMTAIQQTGIEGPRRRVVVNLSPADVRKEGSAFDLPIAVGLLAGDEKMPSGALADYLIMGELSLDGTLLPISGALPMAIKARELGFKGMIVPESNATEAAVVNNLKVYGLPRFAKWLISFPARSTLSPQWSTPAPNLPAPPPSLRSILLKSRGRRL